MDQPPQHDWDNLRFSTRRDRPAPTADAAGQRFFIGVAVAVGIALLYPWYAYQVHSYLLTRDLTRGAEALQKQVDRDTRALQQNLDVLRTQDDATYRSERIAAVRVTGMAQIGDVHRVVVDLGTAHLDESREEICRQSGRWLRRNPRGESLQILRAQRGGPEASVGFIRC